jgi:hypothetical protein
MRRISPRADASQCCHRATATLFRVCQPQCRCARGTAIPRGSEPLILCPPDRAKFRSSHGRWFSTAGRRSCRAGPRVPELVMEPLSVNDPLDGVDGHGVDQTVDLKTRSGQSDRAARVAADLAGCLGSRPTLVDVFQASSSARATRTRCSAPGGHELDRPRRKWPARRPGAQRPERWGSTVRDAT